MAGISRTDIEGFYGELSGNVASQWGEDVMATLDVKVDMTEQTSVQTLLGPLLFSETLNIAASKYLYFGSGTTYGMKLSSNIPWWSNGTTGAMIIEGPNQIEWRHVSALGGYPRLNIRDMAHTAPTAEGHIQFVASNGSNVAGFGVSGGNFTIGNYYGGGYVHISAPDDFIYLNSATVRGPTSGATYAWSMQGNWFYTQGGIANPSTSAGQPTIQMINGVLQFQPNWYDDSGTRPGFIMRSIGTFNTSAWLEPGGLHEWNMIGHGTSAFYSMHAKFMYDDDGNLGSYDEEDDLNILEGMKPWIKDGEVQRDDHGMPLVDYNTIPDFVKGPSTKRKDGKERPKYVRSSNLAMLSIGAVKQLHRKVKDQDETILKLVDKINDLEKKISAS